MRNSIGRKGSIETISRRLFAAKVSRRRALARLPFEEKMRIVADLQKLHLSLARFRD